MMRKRRSTYKPCLEILEDRLCLSTYSVVDLGTLGGISSGAADINLSGQVAGSANTPAAASHAFLWQNGAMSDLGTLGGTNSYAGGLNNAAQVVGQADTGAVTSAGYAVYHAFLWQSGTISDLGALGGPDSYASAINNASQVQVVGSAQTGAVDASGNPVWQSVHLAKRRHDRPEQTLAGQLRVGVAGSFRR